MHLRILLPILLISGTVSAQNSDTLLYERFETGGNSFSLNSSDMGGVTAAVGYNQWIINNAYTGGSGQLICSGFPTTFNVPDTPLQPAGTTGGPATNYMHLMSDAGQASGILNCSFLAANGLCGNDEYNFSRMAQDVNTTSYDSVTVSFIWMCAGGATIYGQLYYSTDSGISWTQVTSPINQFVNQTTWTTYSTSLPAFTGQGTLRFGFRFVNEVTFSANDPGFAIDEFLVTAKVSSPAPVAAFSVSDSAFCQGACVDFIDQSANSPTSWLWIFQGSSTSFSTQQNPTNICFLAPGTYPVTLIVGNAMGSDTLTLPAITVYPAPPIPGITNLGDTLFTTPGYVSYEWWWDGLTFPGGFSDTIIAPGNGLYEVTVTDTNGCSTTSGIFILNTGLAENNPSAVQVYPNPANETLYIEVESGIYEVIIYNIIGEKISQVTISKQLNNSIDISALRSGVYYLKLISNEEKVYHSEFTKL